ncbi:MAG: hypothetical protein M3261_00900 [Thermoproteota archaeon]|nr:hypothetical protein [Thermoproteota archaeon]
MFFANVSSLAAGLKFKFINLIGVSILALIIGSRSSQAQVQTVQDAQERENILKTLVAGLKAREELLESKTVTGMAMCKEFRNESYWAKLDYLDKSKTARQQGHYADRDLALLRFSLSKNRWIYEVQQLYWSGANIFFNMDYQRKATDVKDLYIRVACDGEKIYHYGEIGGSPTGVMETLQSPYSGLEQLLLGDWMGLTWHDVPFSKRLSLVGGSTRLGSLEKELVAGQSTYKVTYGWNSQLFLIEERMWVAPDLNFAVVKWEKTTIDKKEPRRGGLEVVEWLDFSRVSDISLPRRCLQRYFDYHEKRTPADIWQSARETSFMNVSVGDDPPNLFDFSIRLGTILDGWNGGILRMRDTKGANRQQLREDWQKSQVPWQEAKNFPAAPGPRVNPARTQPLTGQELKALAAKYGFPLP